jgi:hypothetical protein
MPRFHVVMFDPADNTTHGHIMRIDHPADAICNHPWITEIYKNTWIAKHVWADDVASCISNVMNILGWATLCVNLDEAIMSALNAGDSSACSQTQQN